MTGPWHGLRVLEIGQHVAAPYATKLLADLGADVVKVERPVLGDPLRAWGPFPGDVPDQERCGLFQYLNTNKRSVALDLVADRERLLQLVAWADVVVENLAAGALERLALGFDDMRGVNARVVLVRISNFGQTGPYRDVEATDLTLQAASGLMGSRGMPGRPPVMVGGRLVEYAAGVSAAVAALTAFRFARTTGRPAQADVSVQEAILCVLSMSVMAPQDRWAELPPVRSHRGSWPGIVACKDGYVGINALTAQQRADTMNLLGTNDLEGRQTTEEFYERIQPWLDARTAREIVEQGQLFRIPVAPVSNGATLLDLEQFASRLFFVKHPWADFTQPGSPYRFARSPATLRTPSPKLGEHTAQVVASLPAVVPAPPVIAKGPVDRPLSDVRLLDLTTFLSGTSATMYLASMGADVVKVESVQRPDGYRGLSTVEVSEPRWYETSLIWQAANLDKRDVTIDLTRPEGMAILERLLAASDVLIENFSPRVVENFGLTYEAACRVKPDIVYVRCPGFGLEGPWREYVGWAMAFEQTSGMAWVNGYPDSAPMVVGGACDGIVAMHIVVAVLSALEHRRRTGEGQLVEVAQTEVAACLTAEQVIEYTTTGRVMSRNGNRARGLVQGVYPCAGANRWVAVSIRDDADWARLVGVMGDPPWTRDPRLHTQESRIVCHDEIDERIGSWTRSRALREVVGALRDAGVPASDVVAAAQLHGDPQIVHRALFQELDHPVTGRRPYLTWPMTYSFGVRDCHYRTAPTLGQHNREVLGAELGLSDDELAELAEKHVIGERALHW